MKKLITSLIVCILLLVISSCAAPYEDGYPRFTYYQNIELNGDAYTLYLPANFDESIRYYYTQSYSVSTLETWTINIEYTTEYIIEGNLNLDDSFDLLLPELKEKIAIDFPNVELSANKAKEEIEFTLENSEKKEINYVLIEYYYPLKLSNNITYETAIIYLPIYKDMLIKNGELIQAIDKDVYINFDLFTSLGNVYSKRDTK